ncbi:MAG: response regulator [Elusimicrobiota bacterium]
MHTTISDMNNIMCAVSTTILVIDDDPDILKTLKHMLECSNYTVDSACCEKEALSIIEKKHINIVLSDYNLGTDNGLDLLEKIRKQKPEIKTILMSGAFCPNETDMHRIDDFLSKPFDLHKLRSTINKTLNKE